MEWESVSAIPLVRGEQNNVPIKKLRLLDPRQRRQIFNNDDINDPDGFLHPQWIRRDLLGMPMEWENKCTLVIPATAFERVVEEFQSFKIKFEEVM